MLWSGWFYYLNLLLHPSCVSKVLGWFALISGLSLHSQFIVPVYLLVFARHQVLPELVFLGMAVLPFLNCQKPQLSWRTLPYTGTCLSEGEGAGVGAASALETVVYTAAVN